MTMGFEGKVALVTGAASGIGRASALAFARERARVVVADVDAKGGEETAGRINEGGGEAVFVQADVSNAASVAAMVDAAVAAMVDAAVAAMVDAAVAAYGRLDCAHNNAGILGELGVLLHEYREEDWDRIMAVNLKGVWLCMKYEIPQMLSQGGGALVNTASVAGLVGSRFAAAYGASKHGVVGLTRTAALQYAQHGIRVNAVCPGLTRTTMAERIFSAPEIMAHRTASQPVGRVGTPEEVAESVVWLCSDAASFVTGHAMAVDGGYVAQ